MNLDAVVEKAVADAKAAGATDAEADAKGKEARSEAERVMAHPLYQSRDTEARKAFNERDKANDKARAAVREELEELRKANERLASESSDAQPIVTRAKALNIGEWIKTNQLPKTVSKFGTKVDEIFVSRSAPACSS